MFSGLWLNGIYLLGSESFVFSLKSSALTWFFLMVPICNQINEIYAEEIKISPNWNELLYCISSDQQQF